MNKTIKLIATIIGIGILAYGTYTLIIPETSLSLGPLSVEAQDNTNSYITIAFGLLILTVGIFAGNKN